MPNRLAGETSPYLLAHAENPVEWYPWGTEALALARREDKPIFLSIGYSACHWCHVMEEESFANPAIAALLAADFVAVKVDREERPDLDAVYMKAVQAMTGAGGWPLTVFLTPALEPFFGGTYFPPYAHRGRPGFSELLASLARGWREDRERLVIAARRHAADLVRDAGANARAPLSPTVLDRSLEMLRENFDDVYGGFGDEPKFPRALDLRLALRHHRRTGRRADLALATRSLEGMARGGIHDQLGGGFHRYSTDERWLVPHFEKMLYDNALLLPAYLEAHAATGRADFAEVARGIVGWTLREMRTSEGGFSSAQDADTNGAEGLFFTWTPDEMTAVLGARTSYWAQEWFGVEDDGNFEGGRSVLARPAEAEEVAARLGVDVEELARAMTDARAALFAARERRERPALDDKVLSGWNALMISGLASAHQLLGDADALAAARGAARFVLERMRRGDGGLATAYRAGRARFAGGLDDHAFAIQALIDLYESDFDPTWLREALALCEVVERDFRDDERGGYYQTSVASETPLARLRGDVDGALPGGNGVHALNLLRLAELTGRGALARRAEDTLTAFGQRVNAYPIGYASLLLAVDFLAAGPREVVLAGRLEDPRVEALLTVVRRTLSPRVVALADGRTEEDLVPLVDGKEPGPGGARAYVCRAWACGEPVEEAEALAALLED